MGTDDEQVKDVKKDPKKHVHHPMLLWNVCVCKKTKKEKKHKRELGESCN